MNLTGITVHYTFVTIKSWCFCKGLDINLNAVNLLIEKMITTYRFLKCKNLGHFVVNTMYLIEAVMMFLNFKKARVLIYFTTKISKN